MKRRDHTPEEPARAPRATRACLAVLEGGRAVLLAVRAQPGAKRSGFAGFWNGLPKITVSAPPEKGRANEEIAEVIAGLFSLRGSSVSLASGATSRLKKFRLACAPERVEARLAELERNEEERA